MKMRSWSAGIVACSLLGGAVGLSACGDDSGELTGASCESVDDCYLDVEGIAGTVECLDKASLGYCTHTCTSDSDCCAAEGECPSGKKQVCAPFESTGKMLCFLSCEAADVGGDDPGAYCQQFANVEFGCRSTGGGNDNRKVCFPN